MGAEQERASLDVVRTSGLTAGGDDPSSSPACQAQHAGSRAIPRGRSFPHIAAIVSAARKSFELPHRQEETQDPNEPPPTMKRYFTQALWLDHQSGMHVAHAPPANLAEPPLPPESEEDEHEYVEHIDVKAISLEGLRRFVKSHSISPTMTTQQVVRSIIIPATMGSQGALVDADAWSRHALPAMDSPGAAAARKAAGPLPHYTRMPKSRTVTGLKRRAPYYYVVHAWSRPFLETVDMIEKYFAGRPSEHTYVWLDVFAVPQASPDHSGVLHEIQRAIWYATSTLACFDATGTVLGRLWCCYEMFYTLISKQCAHALIALTASPFNLAQRTALYRKINAAKAQCSVKEDRKKLHEHVEGYTRRGFPAINNYLRSGLLLPPYDHPAVFLPQVAYEAQKGGLFSCLPCMAPPPPPPPPSVPDHIASVPMVAEPSIRKGMAGYGDAAPGSGGGLPLAFEEKPLRLLMGACNIPHPLKTKTGGEDAYFLSAAGRGAMGVADGVGSWSADDGVDPAAYSRDLMRGTASSIEASGGRVAARMALADAHLTVKHAGSSTSIVAVMPPDKNILQVVNMGDSGLRVVRNGRLAMATRPQSHAHNMPYQMACPDEPVCDTDCTVQGDVYAVHVEAGDVIIMATDGMFDNVWPETMLDIVNKAMSAPLEEDDVACLSTPAHDLPIPKRPTVPTVTLSTAATASTASCSDAATTDTVETETGTTTGANSGTEALACSPKRAVLVVAGEEDDGIGKHAPVAGDAGETILADASTNYLPPSAACLRASLLARTLARTAGANMLRRDVRSPFAVELSKQPNATPEFRANPRGGKPDDVTVVVAVVVEADEQSLAAVQQAWYRAYLTVNSLDTNSQRLAGNSGRLQTVEAVSRSNLYQH